MLEHDWDQFGRPTKKINGFHYIVTSADYTLKWVEAKPICDKNA